MRASHRLGQVSDKARSRQVARKPRAPPLLPRRRKKKGSTYRNSFRDSISFHPFFEYVSRLGTVDGRLRNARLGFNRLTSRRNVCRYERSNGVVARLGTHRRIAGTEITQGTRLINSVVQRNIIRASTRINPREGLESIRAARVHPPLRAR